METCEVLGSTFSEDYPYNLFTLQTMWGDKENRPTLLLLNRDYGAEKSVVVYSVGYGGVLGHLPRSIADRVAHDIDSGVDYQVENLWLTSHPMDVEFDRPRLEITFRKVKDFG